MPQRSPICVHDIRDPIAVDHDVEDVDRLVLRRVAHHGGDLFLSFTRAVESGRRRFVYVVPREEVVDCVDVPRPPDLVVVPQHQVLRVHGLSSRPECFLLDV
jgi:hypothetical protein